MADDDTPAWSQAKIEHHRGALSLLATPFLGATIILGFLWSPIVAKLDPDLAMIGGLLMAAGFFVFVANVTYWEFDDRLAGRCVIGFLLGAALILYGLVDVLRSNERRLKQCALLQQDMFALKHERPDSRELFDVMHCEVQRVGTLRFRHWPNQGVVHGPVDDSR